VQIHADVKSVLALVAAHLMASLVTGRPDPASWSGSTHFPESPTLGAGRKPAIPITLGDGLRPVTTEAMRSIPARQATGPAYAEPVA
jgi:hypothetical protein